MMMMMMMMLFFFVLLGSKVTHDMRDFYIAYVLWSKTSSKDRTESSSIRYYVSKLTIAHTRIRHQALTVHTTESIWYTAYRVCVTTTSSKDSAPTHDMHFIHIN